MRKIIVSEGISLDGVFDAQTMGQWAVPYYSEEREEFVRAAILSADTLLLGRVTYDLQAWYWPNQKADKYGIANHKNSMVKYVVTSTPLQAQWNNSNVIQDNALEEIAKLKQQPGQDILIEGSGTLVESLARAGLIDEYRILLHPSIAGSGKRFFKGGINLTLLKLVENKTLSQGVVALRYEPGEK
jgi:dihydrofolate reductase